MNYIKKAFYYTFCTLERFFEFMYDDGYSVHKAFTLIIFFEFFWIDNIIGIYSLNQGDDLRFYDSPFMGMLYAVTLGAINYYFLLRKDRWKSYQQKFRKLSTKVKIYISLTFFVLSLMAIGLDMYLVGQHLELVRSKSTSQTNPAQSLPAIAKL